MLFQYCLEQLFQAAMIGTLPQRSRNSLNRVQLKIPLLHNDEIPVTNALKKDLLHLCQINAIDPLYHNFCNDLKCTEDTGNTAPDVIDPNKDDDDEENGSYDGRMDGKSK